MMPARLMAPAALALLLSACATPPPKPMATPMATATAPVVAVAAAAPALPPPMAARHPRDVTVHGDTRIDDYFWLRERDNPEVTAYLKAEAAYTAQWFAPRQGLTDTLYQEMVGRVEPADEAPPMREGRWWYSSRTLDGAQYPQLIRRAAMGPARALDETAPVQVMLDLNELAKGRKFLALGTRSVSPDGTLLAYSIDETGARDFTLHLRRLATGQDLPLTVPKTMDLVWAADSRHFFYLTADDTTRRTHRLWRQRADAAQPPQLVYEETDPLFNLMLGKTADGRYLLLTSMAKNTTEVRLLAANRPQGAWRPVLPRQAGQEYSVEHRQGQLYLRLNDTGPNFRLVRLPLPRALPVRPAQLARAQQLLAQRPDALLEAITMFRTHYVAQWRGGGSVRLVIHAVQGGGARDMAFDAPTYVAQARGWSLDLNREYDSPFVRLSYDALATPNRIYDADLATGRLTLRKEQPVKGGYDASRYASERIWATAADGTRVPISLIYAKAQRRSGPQPLLLYGYGSYGISSDPRFSSERLSLLDRGVIFAIAHIRGGSEMGRPWYLGGKLSQKMNTFTDFIASAEALIGAGYTTPQQLIIRGGSAGGLLMGAVVNLRPELFKAVVAEVPFVDVINTMLDETIPLTTEEFIEWGNPKQPAEYAWMRAYSPYDNLKPGPYPAMLLRTGFNDSQVPYWEPAKYTARLRTLKTNDTPLLFDINMDVGHGGASGRFDALRERARVDAFMLAQWGLVP
ncbi:MAG: S9 family peptidase [Proteobacteria bacterium]|nr:S9 family peptidase [Pseudomonadota bacterium]